jgi:hypothetical protein
MARTLAIYAERRHFLTPARRREIARHLTVPLIDRFEFRNDIDPDLLLYALYYKTFLADPSGDPPDLGPLAGYSPLLRDVDRPPAAITGPTASSPPDSAVPSPDSIGPIIESDGGAKAGSDAPAGGPLT